MNPRETMVPKQWHVYVVDLEPRVGSKPGKQRPCLVVQPTELNEAGHTSTVVLPITSRLTAGDAFPLRVRLPQGCCGLRVESEALVDQILAWDNRFFNEDLGSLPDELRDQVKSALVEFLDL